MSEEDKIKMINEAGCQFCCSTQAVTRFFHEWICPISLEKIFDMNSCPMNEKRKRM